MATAAFMEERTDRGPLGVSKNSHRIGKIRRPGTGSSAGSNQRAPPTVYKIEPEGFRSLVQQLTGPSLPKIPISNNTSRLHNLAPPPLAPSSLNSPAAAASAFKPSFFSPNFDFASAAGMSPKFAFSPLTFSPLADLTPRDSVWATAGLESPGTADIKTLAQLVAGDEPMKPLDRAAHSSFSFPGKFGSSSPFEMSSEFHFSNL